MEWTIQVNGTDTLPCLWWQTSPGRRRSLTWACPVSARRVQSVVQTSCPGWLDFLWLLCPFFTLVFLPFLFFLHWEESKGQQRLKVRPKSLCDCFIVYFILQCPWLKSSSLSLQFTTAAFNLSFWLGQRLKAVCHFLAKLIFFLLLSTTKKCHKCWVKCFFRQTAQNAHPNKRERQKKVRKNKMA